MISRTWSVRIECLFGLLIGICPLLPKEAPIATNCSPRTLLMQRPATVSMLLSLPAVGEVQTVGHDAIDGRVQGRVKSGSWRLQGTQCAYERTNEGAVFRGHTVLGLGSLRAILKPWNSYLDLRCRTFSIIFSSCLYLICAYLTCVQKL